MPKIDTAELEARAGTNYPEAFKHVVESRLKTAPQLSARTIPTSISSSSATTAKSALCTSPANPTDLSGDFR